MVCRVCSGCVHGIASDNPGTPGEKTMKGISTYENIVH
jgi:hypothetical protein